MIEYLICYDVSADDARARVAAKLSAFGIRQQASVFLCSFRDSEELEAVMDHIATSVNESTDVVQAFAQCSRCVSDRRDHGQVAPSVDDPFWVV